MKILSFHTVFWNNSVVGPTILRFEQQLGQCCNLSTTPEIIVLYDDSTDPDVDSSRLTIKDNIDVGKEKLMWMTDYSISIWGFPPPNHQRANQNRIRTATHPRLQPPNRQSGRLLNWYASPVSPCSGASRRGRKTTIHQTMRSRHLHHATAPIAPISLPSHSSAMLRSIVAFDEVYCRMGGQQSMPLMSSP